MKGGGVPAASEGGDSRGGKGDVTGGGGRGRH